MRKLIAYCGLDCEKCEAFTATKNNDEALKQDVAKHWSELNNAEITPEMINCEGCRAEGLKTPFCDSLCPIRQCALVKDIPFCGECPDMASCEKLRMITSNSEEACENLKMPTDNSIIFSELTAYGLTGAAAELIRKKDGVTVARVGNGARSYILKAFDEDVSHREIENYRILASLGVPTLKLCGSTERSLLMEDIDASPVLRLGVEADVNDPAVAAALGRWYRVLHERGGEYVKEHGAGMYDEWDLFTAENLDLIARRLPDCETPVRVIKESFPNIRSKMDAAPKTLCYNDFYYTNMAVAKDKSFALMFDYNLLGKGCFANDILNVTYDMKEDAAAVFLKEYGRPDEELLLLAQKIAPAISLISALGRGIFPPWAEAEKETFIKQWNK